LATLHARSHVEFEMRSAERRPGSKATKSRSTTSSLNLCSWRVRRTGKIIIAESAVLKRFGLGLNSASLRRMYDEVMMYPESDIDILTQELVRRESRDDPTNYKANVVREEEKSNHPSAETVVKQVLAV